jgi:2-keto-4-pentenoate hydratase
MTVSATDAVPVEQLAEQFARAETNRQPLPPLSEHYPRMDVDEAYAIQRAGRRLRELGGARVVGHKIGLTATAMQQQLGVDEPDYGYLTDHMMVANGAAIDSRRLIAPRVEGEIAFILGTPLSGASVTSGDVLDATAAIAPALEIIDSRIADWRIKLADTIADNASSGMAVIGPRVALDDLDLACLPMVLTVGSAVAEGRGDAVLGHPAASVAWLVRALAPHGESLAAGEIVLSGALARALPVGPGDTASAYTERLGVVSVRFA